MLGLTQPMQMDGLLGGTPRDQGILAAALAGGTVVFAGLDSVWTQNIAAAASLVAIGINSYLGGTTVGRGR